MKFDITSNCLSAPESFYHLFRVSKGHASGFQRPKAGRTGPSGISPLLCAPPQCRLEGYRVLIVAARVENIADGFAGLLKTRLALS